MSLDAKKDTTLFLFFTEEASSGMVEAFQEDWLLYGPGTSAPLSFRNYTGRKAEWSCPLQEDDFDRVAVACDRWFAAGKLRKASLLDEDEFGASRRWNLLPKD